MGGHDRERKLSSCPPWKFRSKCEGCHQVIQMPACSLFYRCIHCPSHTADLCRHCFQSHGGLPQCPTHVHCYVQGDLRGQLCCWKPARGPAEATLPADTIRSMQGRELGADDYDVLLGLEEGSRQQQSLPHFLVERGISTVYMSSSGESHAASLLVNQPGQFHVCLSLSYPPISGQDGCLDSNDNGTTCVICHVGLAAQPIIKCLPCKHVAHESCILSHFLEASHGYEGGSGEDLATATCPGCGSCIFPNLRLRYISTS